MKVRFSPDCFRFQRYGGVSRYFVELHRGLRERGIDSRIEAGLHVNDLLVDEPGVRGTHVGHLGGTGAGHRPRQAVTKAVDAAWAEVVSRRLGPDDLYHATWYPPRIPSGPTLVTTVFDMIPERYPDLVARAQVTSQRKRAWCAAARLVFAISDQTRHDLLERFGLDPDRVVVTPLGVRRVEPAAVAPDLPSRPFVLYVGDRRSGYKNLDLVLAALARPGPAHELDLVCFGGGATDAVEQAGFADRGLAGRIRVVQGDDHVLAAAYARASMLVYPSRYEGFGLPPLEAMVHDCPVVATRAGSIPEVVGDAAALVDPQDDEELAVTIASVLTDEARRADLVERGRRRVQRYTWEATVDATLAAYLRGAAPVGS